MKKYLLIAAAAIVLTALSAFVYGYEYGITPNHIQIIPFIEKIKENSDNQEKEGDNKILFFHNQDKYRW